MSKLIISASNKCLDTGSTDHISDRDGRSATNTTGGACTVSKTKVVAAYLKSKQLLLFDFVGQYTTVR